jgi:NarL family two-component system response regulator LiaR
LTQNTGKHPIRILIADDHPVVRHGLRTLLGTEPGFEVVAEAVNGLEAIREAERTAPDIVLMDLVMPEIDGVEAMKQILAKRPETRILVLTSFGNDCNLFPALDAGANGFLLKDCLEVDLAGAIRQVSNGQSAVSPAIARRILQEFSHDNEDEAPEESLTERETEVLRLIAQGLSNAGIADALFISPATVRTHVSNIFGKLHLDRRTQAVVYALKHGIATLDGDDESA